MSQRIEWILFDWGNVLVEYRPLGFPKLAEALRVDLGTLSRFADGNTFFHDLTVGALSAEDTVALLERRFGVALTRAQIAECFRADVERELAGIRTLIGELKAVGRQRLAILSNAFFGHWDNFEGGELHAMFELPMSSHLIKAAKPEAEAFEIALRQMGTSAERVVFIDDQLENVEAARRLGLHAFVSDSVATTRAGVAELLGGELGSGLGARG